VVHDQEAKPFQNLLDTPAEPAEKRSQFRVRWPPGASDFQGQVLSSMHTLLPRTRAVVMVHWGLVGLPGPPPAGRAPTGDLAGNAGKRILH